MKVKGIAEIAMANGWSFKLLRMVAALGVEAIVIMLIQLVTLVAIIFSQIVKTLAVEPGSLPMRFEEYSNHLLPCQIIHGIKTLHDTSP